MPRLRWRMYLRHKAEISTSYATHHVPPQCSPWPITFSIQPFIITPKTPSTFIKNKAYSSSKFAWQTTSTPIRFQQVRQSPRDDIRLRIRRRSLFLSTKFSAYTTPQTPPPSRSTTEAQRSSPKGRSRRSRPGSKIGNRTTCGEHVAIITKTHQTLQSSTPSHEQKIYRTHQTKAGRLHPIVRQERC